jgi:hypothetical protein
VLSIYKRGKLEKKNKKKKFSFFCSVGGWLLLERGGEMISKFLHLFSLENNWVST